MSTRTLDLATRMAEREWKHHKKYPNTPMPVIADVRAELDRLTRQVRKLHDKDYVHTAKFPCFSCKKIDDVLDLIKKAKK